MKKPKTIYNHEKILAVVTIGSHHPHFLSLAAIAGPLSHVSKPKTGRSSSQLQGPEENWVINVSRLSTTSNLIREAGPFYVEKLCRSPAQQFGDARFMDGCPLLTDV